VALASFSSPFARQEIPTPGTIFPTTVDGLVDGEANITLCREFLLRPRMWITLGKLLARNRKARRMERLDGSDLV